jgi:peptide/nickel transport system substrate-binding protein
VLAGTLAAVAVLTTGCLTTEQPADRARGSAVVIGVSAPLSTLDPMATTSVGTDLSVLSSVYTSLVVRGPDLALHPSAASSWEQVEPTRWRFHLDPRVTFADGSRLDADVVVWNIERLLNEDLGLRMTSNFPDLTGAEKIDAATVDLVTEKPWFALPDAMSFLFLLSPGWAQTHDPVRESMGSGPYEIVSYSPGGNIRLRARDDYWGPAPAIADVTYRITPSQSAQVSGLLSGELDLVTGIDPQDVDRLRVDRSLTVHQTDTTRMAFIKLNTLTGPTTDLRVRQAMNHAVDKQAIVDSLLKGTVGESPGQLITPDYTGYTDGLQAYPFDPDRARQLLAEAGYGPEARLAVELTLPSGQYVAGELVVQAVAQQLAQVGVDVTIRTEPFSVYMQKYLKERAMPDLQYITQAWPTLSADGVYGLFVSTSPYAYWDDAVFTDAVSTARGAPTEAERDAAFAVAAHRAREQAPVIFLFPQPGISATAAELRWQVRPDDWVRPADMSWARPPQAAGGSS